MKTNAQLLSRSRPVKGKFKSTKLGGTAITYNSPKKMDRSSDWTGTDLPSSLTFQGTLTHISRCHQTFFSRTPEIVLAIRPLDREISIGRQGYRRPLAGTENCYCMILCKYKGAQCEMPKCKTHAYSAEVSWGPSCWPKKRNQNRICHHEYQEQAQKRNK